MNAAPLDLLEPDELLMLALQASGRGDSASAIAYLKLTLSKAPSDARAHWAIAAEYASLNLPERAAEHFATSVELDPKQPVARFQYGLLMLTSGRLGEAESIWEPLAELSPTDPVRLFKEGLLHMVRDEFAPALSSLRAALAQPGIDAALGRDVEMTIARIEEAQKDLGAAASATDPTDAAAAAESVESHLALSAYRTGSSGTH